MKMMLSMHVKDACLMVFVGGPFSLEEAKRTFSEVLETVGREHVDKVLFDGSAITGDVKRMERFYYGVFAANSVNAAVVRNLKRAPRFAYVLKSPVLDANRHGEEVARSRGMIVKTFPYKEDAIEWLYGTT